MTFGDILTATDGTAYLVVGHSPDGHYELRKIPEGMKPIDFGRRFFRDTASLDSTATTLEPLSLPILDLMH